MSLINDALKRAKQAQQDALPVPAASMQFRPIEHQQYAGRRVGLAVPTLLAMASMVLLFLLWQAARNPDASQPRDVKARTKAPMATSPNPQPAPAIAAATPAPPISASTPSPATPPSAAPTVTAVSAPEPIPAAATNPPVLLVVNAEGPVAAPTEAPKAPLPKLQGIVFHPTRPSVLINGRTLFVGDKLGEFRVRVIGQESVTLVGNGQTNVLTLAE